MKKIPVLLVMATFATAASVCSASDVAPVAAPAAAAAPAPIANAPGVAVPAWEVKAADSDTMFSSEKLKGQPYGIVFVNSSCASCRSELGQLTKLKFDKFTLIVAAVDARLDRILANYRDQMKVTSPIVDDSKFALAKKFGVSFTPASVIVGADGKVEVWNAGFTEDVAGKLMTAFAKYAKK